MGLDVLLLLSSFSFCHLNWWGGNKLEKTDRLEAPGKECDKRGPLGGISCHLSENF